MQAIANKVPPVVSARAYALILTSPRLRRMLLPQGFLASPYEILDYQATLTLEDPTGIKATFRRTQQIRFLQNGVSGILDHVWGDGVALTSYSNEAGSLKDSVRDEGRRHLVVGLKRPMSRGEKLTFRVKRIAMVGFTKDDEWVETTIDHPAKQLSRSIVFPAQRPCRGAILRHEGVEVPLPVVKLADGRTKVSFKVSGPRVDSPYRVSWSW